MELKKILQNYIKILFLILLICRCGKKKDFFVDLEEIKTSNKIYLPNSINDLKETVFGDYLKSNNTPINNIIGEHIYYRPQKFKLHEKIYSILVHPEWNSLILNFDLEGNYLGKFDVGDCKGSAYMLNDEIICNQNYGYPFYPFKKFKVDSLGQFIETYNYVPSQSKRLEQAHRNFIIEKLPFLKATEKINLFDEEFFRDEYPNSIQITKDELKKLFLIGTSTEIEEPKYVGFLGKIKTAVGFVVAIDLFYEFPHIDSQSKFMFLSYSSEYRLIDTLFPSSSVIKSNVFGKTITLVTEPDTPTELVDQVEKYKITKGGVFQRF